MNEQPEAVKRKTLYSFFGIPLSKSHKVLCWISLIIFLPIGFGTLGLRYGEPDFWTLASVFGVIDLIWLYSLTALILNRKKKLNPKPRKKLYKRWWFRVLASCLLFAAVRANVVAVRNDSMWPMTQNGEFIPFQRWFFTPKRGDVVVFQVDSPTSITLGRIVGLPEESVEIQNGQVAVNGEPLNEPYAKGETKAFGNSSMTLGSEDYYILGDNRENARDSRFFGMVPRSAIIGRVLFVIP